MKTMKAPVLDRQKKTITVTKEFLDYARPLSLGESAVVWQGGIPKHFVVK